MIGGTFFLAPLARYTRKVAPFDIVFEYNHAIEGWQALSRPTISRLGGMVHAVGDFMREMSHLVQKEYARCGNLDMDRSPQRDETYTLGLVSKVYKRGCSW